MQNSGGTSEPRGVVRTSGALLGQDIGNSRLIDPFKSTRNVTSTIFSVTDVPTAP